MSLVGSFRALPGMLGASIPIPVLGNGDICAPTDGARQSHSSPTDPAKRVFIQLFMLALQRGRWRVHTLVELRTFLIARKLRRRVFLQKSPRDDQAAVFVLPHNFEHDE